MSVKKTLDIENALKELTKIVNKLEKGNLSLEESLNCFETGITLTKQCQVALDTAEQKIQVLLQKNGLENLEDISDQFDGLDEASS